MKELNKICKQGQLVELAELYIRECTSFNRESSKKGGGRFPNFAGFARKLGIGVASLKSIREKYPEQYGAMLALFEDEALNSDKNATILNAYIKERLDFGEKKEGGATLPVGDVRVVFEHDALEDGM